MKKLTDMIAAVKTAKITGGNPDRIEGPMFDGVSEFPYVYSNLIDLFRHDKGDNGKIPQEVMNLVLAAYSWGATSALSTLKTGLVIRDKDGKAVDRAYYSLDELLSEAEAIGDPNFQLKTLEHEIEILKVMDEQMSEAEWEPIDESQELEEEMEVETVQATIVSVDTGKHLH